MILRRPRAILIALSTFNSRSLSIRMSAGVPKRVAIIGGGAAGLVTARTLRDVGIRVKVFEKADHVGGVWAHDAGSPMYAGLVTNLPKQIMAYFGENFSDSLPSFLTHKDCYDYLNNYAQKYDLLSVINFNCCVRMVNLNTPKNENETSAQSSNDWEVTYHTKDTDKDLSENFDAVVVCNGHYDVPALPVIPGAEDYTGVITHSKDYDTPGPFSGNSVLCVGARASGTDIAREISAVASVVHVSNRSNKGKITLGGEFENIWQRPAIERFTGGKAIRFTDGTSIEVDHVILCTGYEYNFPFFSQSTAEKLPLTWADRRVHPLYMHMFHTYRIDLCFVGIPHSVVPFPQFQLQANLIAAVYTGQVSLPGVQEREAWLKEDEEHRLSFGLRPYTDAHYMGDMQWAYNRMLAEKAGCLTEHLQKELALMEAIYNDAQDARPKVPGDPDTYRSYEYINCDATHGTFEVIKPSQRESVQTN